MYCFEHLHTQKFAVYLYSIRIYQNSFAYARTEAGRKYINTNNSINKITGAATDFIINKILGDIRVENFIIIFLYQFKRLQTFQRCVASVANLPMKISL